MKISRKPTSSDDGQGELDWEPNDEVEVGDELVGELFVDGFEDESRDGSIAAIDPGAGLKAAVKLLSSKAEFDELFEPSWPLVSMHGLGLS